MAFTAGDIIRITAKLSFGAQDIQNVYHLQMDDTTAETYADVLDDIATDLDGSYQNISGALYPSIHFDTIQGYNLTADAYLGEVAWPTLTQGTQGSGTMMPVQMAPLIRFVTPVLGSQGRKFLPPIGSANMDADGSLTSGMLNSIILMGTSLLSPAAGPDWTAHYGNWNSALSSFRPWVWVFGNDYPCVQRRRRPGVGS